MVSVYGSLPDQSMPNPSFGMNKRLVLLIVGLAGLAAVLMLVNASGTETELQYKLPPSFLAAEASQQRDEKIASLKNKFGGQTYKAQAAPQMLAHTDTDEKDNKTKAAKLKLPASFLAAEASQHRDEQIAQLKNKFGGQTYKARASPEMLSHSQAAKRPTKPRSEFQRSFEQALRDQQADLKSLANARAFFHNKLRVEQSAKAKAKKSKAKAKQTPKTH
eukprot:CAMPEP_0114542572 /NCGR_PEP_ID=MMETSP0114-20121206/1904_1 /TAXON_ID=31324 /ORGANISM="Goniomonas sp, Strain m" /LENGTH=218 /DNA_ID=CAMNT_0001726873 /DNA_START=11 /DNA_END=667 /DNA_ORIENTATION=-